MTTENPYVAAMSKLKETTVTAGAGTNYTNVTMATVVENKKNNGSSATAYENLDLS